MRGLKNRFKNRTISRRNLFEIALRQFFRSYLQKNNSRLNHRCNIDSNLDTTCSSLISCQLIIMSLLNVKVNGHKPKSMNTLSEN